MRYVTNGIPNDIRTLVIRNIECLFIRFGYITKENIDFFREELTEELLYILDCYTKDKETTSIELSVDKYIDDTITLRDLEYHVETVE